MKKVKIVLNTYNENRFDYTQFLDIDEYFTHALFLFPENYLSPKEQKNFYKSLETDKDIILVFTNSRDIVDSFKGVKVEFYKHKYEDWF